MICIIAIIICSYIFYCIRKISKDGFLNSFYVLFYLIQVILAIGLYIYDKNYMLGNNLKIVLFLESFSYASVTACFGVLIGQFIANKVFGIHAISLNRRINILSKKYDVNKISWFFLIGFIFTILSSLDLSYVFAVFALSFSFSPVIIGLFWNKINKKVKAIWIIALIINFIFHIVQGSRGTALFPIIFVVIGYLFAIHKDKSKMIRMSIIYGILFLISMPFFSFIQFFREYYGRGLDVSFENIELMWKVAELYNEGKINDDENEVDNSFGRFLIGPNVAVPYMTPKRVPYRGYKAMDAELQSMVSLKGSEGRKKAREDLGSEKYGLGVASKYGFFVSDTSSVEWPLFADGYSRFGYTGVFVYSILFAFVLAALEKLVNKLHYKYSLLSFVLMLFILYNGVLSYMYSYFDFFKVLIFRFALVIIVTILIARVCKRIPDYSVSYHVKKKKCLK